jgi:hypothetical protein
MRDRELADNMSVVIWVMEPGGARKYLNPNGSFAGMEMSGTHSALGWLGDVHPAELFEAGSRRRESFQLDYRLRNKNGDYRNARDSAQPWFDQSGEFCGYIGVVSFANDHAARRRFPESGKIVAAQEALRASAATANSFKTPIAPDSNMINLVRDIVALTGWGRKRIGAGHGRSASTVTSSNP